MGASYSDIRKGAMITQKEIHALAKEKGWWDAERSSGECFALMQSELSEALEALRHGNPQDEHCPAFSNAEIELADCVIRILDFCESNGWDIESEKEIYTSPLNSLTDTKWKDTMLTGSAGDVINTLHNDLCLADTYLRNPLGDKNFSLTFMVQTICHIEVFCDRMGWDLDAAIDAKHAYNKTRPYKHGKEF
jgi:NTP pyrophosphatase (non-canonical NTP hydrolase)